MNAGAFVELVKPRPTALACLVAFFGFFAADWPPFDPAALIAAIAGTFFLGGGAAALNQVLEKDSDARMKRTEHRPLPAKRIEPHAAAAFGGVLIALGAACLAAFTSGLTLAIGVAMVAAYVLAYTPLKRTTAHSAWVGAVAGALPPVLGWSAARGELGLGALVLFLLLFFWQIPHVLAIGWVYRTDYERGGFATLASGDRDGRRTIRRILWFSAALFAVSFLPLAAGMVGAIYGWGAFVLGLVVIAFGLRLTPERLDRDGKRYILASVTYLPALLFFWIADHYLGV